MPIVVKVIMCLLYLLIGCVVAVPYTLLSGGNSDSFLTTAWMGPFAAFVLVIVHGMSGSSLKRPKRGGVFFWILVTYFCSPILLNGASLLLKRAGYEAVGNYVFEARYLCLLTFPVLFIIYCMIAGGATSLWRRFGGGAKPPSNTPPSNKSGSNLTVIVLNGEKREDDPGTFQVSIV